MPDRIKYIPSRGKYQNCVFTPVLSRDGHYIVSKTRFKEDYAFVSTLDEIISYVKQGYGIRMNYQGSPASLVMPKSLIEQNPGLFD